VALSQTKYCCSLKSNILTQPKFLAGDATAHASLKLLFHLGKIGFLVDKR